MIKITQSELKSLVSYDPETGLFASLKLGRKISSIMTIGYVVVTIARVKYYGHRLAWFYTHGDWPQIVDHANGIKTDNRIANLRGCTKAQNVANRHQYNANKSGYRGVWKYRGKWIARIMFNRKLISIGTTYATASDASIAYEAKALELRGEFYSPPIARAVFSVAANT